MAHEGALPALQRYITTHNAEGKAVFSTKLREENTMVPIATGQAGFALGYTTKGFPVQLNGDVDIAEYTEKLSTPPGLTVANGSVLRFVDFAPGLDSPMHRTASIDYGVVIEGEVELKLDSGETRVMKRGDVAVQRGTNHGWRNTSDTEWLRMMFVLLPCEPVEVGGTKLGEDLGTMEGVKDSE